VVVDRVEQRRCDGAHFLSQVRGLLVEQLDREHRELEVLLLALGHKRDLKILDGCAEHAQNLSFQLPSGRCRSM
jgi:hypothetical protein